ncbi:cysteine peptidase [Babesia ovis]|uniref:Cysteine peptidase n=1 Tax=Babesia ovis TaxID=5869 RepID=A0A0P0HMY4_BABOV|nr:ovipain-2 [Babesia ovis]GFE53977.1 cysteine peptidase [Babesia ovis]
MEIPTATSDMSNLDDHYVRSEEESRNDALMGHRRRCCFSRNKIMAIVAISVCVIAAVTTGVVLLVTKATGGSKSGDNIRVYGTEESGECYMPRELFKELASMQHLGGFNVKDPAEAIKYMKFIQLTKKFNKKYNDVSEKHSAFMNYRRNYDVVASHQFNRKATYTMDFNHFFDKDMKEVASKLLHKIDIPREENIKTNITDTLVKESNQALYATLKNYSLSYGHPRIGTKVTFEDIDWRRAGGVSPVKDQGMCGSCWAFAAVSAVESIFKIENNMDVRLSEQELVSCQLSCQGCNGGYSDYALNYIKVNGIHSTDKWPYIANDGNCVPREGVKYHIGGYMGAKGPYIATQLLVMAPTVVYVAVSDDLMHYSGGIFNGECSDTELNHAVLLVGEGYDSELKKRYWLLKNSWGPNWGEDGYFRLERTDTQTDKCGVLSYGYMPYKPSISS